MDGTQQASSAVALPCAPTPTRSPLCASTPPPAIGHAVILGTPLLRALLGPQYANLGVVAGISSFIFQLPLMLILFEVHTWRQQTIHGALPEQQQAPPQPQGQDSAAERRRGGDDGSQRAGDGSKRLAAAKQQPTVLSVVDASSVPPPRGAAAAGRSSLGDMMRQRLLGCMGWHMTRKQVLVGLATMLVQCMDACRCCCRACCPPQQALLPCWPCRNAGTLPCPAAVSSHAAGCRAPLCCRASAWGCA